MLLESDRLSGSTGPVMRDCGCTVTMGTVQLRFKLLDTILQSLDILLGSCTSAVVLVTVHTWDIMKLTGRASGCTIALGTPIQSSANAGTPMTRDHAGLTSYGMYRKPALHSLSAFVRSTSVRWPLRYSYCCCLQVILRC